MIVRSVVPVSSCSRTKTRLLDEMGDGSVVGIGSVIALRDPSVRLLPPKADPPEPSAEKESDATPSDEVMNTPSITPFCGNTAPSWFCR